MIRRTLSLTSLMTLAWAASSSLALAATPDTSHFQQLCPAVTTALANGAVPVAISANNLPKLDAKAIRNVAFRVADGNVITLETPSHPAALNIKKGIASGHSFMLLLPEENAWVMFGPDHRGQQTAQGCAALTPLLPLTESQYESLPAAAQTEMDWPVARKLMGLPEGTPMPERLRKS